MRSPKGRMENTHRLVMRYRLEEPLHCARADMSSELALTVKANKLHVHVSGLSELAEPAEPLRKRRWVLVEHVPASCKLEAASAWGLLQRLCPVAPVLRELGLAELCERILQSERVIIGHCGLHERTAPCLGYQARQQRQQQHLRAAACVRAGTQDLPTPTV